MARISNPAAENPKAYLLSVHFPEYSEYLRRTGTRIAGRDASVERPSEVQMQAARTYLAKINALSKDEIAGLVSEAKALEQERLVIAKKAEEAARFYNQPRNKADLRYWAKMSYWSPEDLCALSLGREPTVVNWARISEYSKISEFVREYEKRLMLVSRARAMHQLWDKTPPNLAVAWARRMNFDLPAELVLEVEALGIQIADWKDLHDARVRDIAELNALLEAERAKAFQMHSETMEVMERHAEAAARNIAFHKELREQAERRASELQERVEQLEAQLADSSVVPDVGTRARESLLKIVIGMAIRKYNFKPCSGKNPATANIATHLRELGIGLHEDTIRSYLTEAKELLPPDGGD